MKHNTTFHLVFCALFSALTAAASQICIPIQPVPVNLATLSVFIAGAVLGARLGALSQTVYVLLGTAGLPVFSGFSGGAHVIAGPTGGYLVGYIAAAGLVGFLTERLGRRMLILVGSMAAGLVFCYVLGTLWFMLVTKTGLWASIAMCVFPFLLGDAAKIAAAAAIVPQLAKGFQHTAKGKFA